MKIKFFRFDIRITPEKTTDAATDHNHRMPHACSGMLTSRALREEAIKVDSLDDGGDFKKARGFLLTYSTVLIALWFFGANLTTFKLMGTEIHFEQRTNSIWLALGCLNAYFWFRFVQHIPTGGFRFDKAMNRLYDRALIKAAICRKYSELKRSVKRIQAESYGPNDELKFNRGYAYLTYPERLKQERREQPEAEIDLYDFSREKRTEINVSGHYYYIKKGQAAPIGDYVRLGIYAPSKPLTWTVKAYVLVKGAFITPWFTDHIAPLLIGGLSTFFALWKWYDMNFFAA